MTIGLTGYTPTWMMFSDEGSGSEPIDVDAILNDPRWSRIADEEEIRELHPDLASPWPSFVIDRVKQPPPRRRGRPPKTWDEDAAVDLPRWHAPPGYSRDRGPSGRWRYAATGSVVPGSKDVTLETLYDLARDDDVVLVPVELARSAEELAWCSHVDLGERAVMIGQRPEIVLEVPMGEWDKRCHVPLGLSAPELALDRLLDFAGVARMAGVLHDTVVSYYTRRAQVPEPYRFPEPVARFGGSPVWSGPIIRAWLSARPGQGTGGGRPKAEPARKKTVRAGSRRQDGKPSAGARSPQPGAGSNLSRPSRLRG
jgi:hypothetical protein